MVGSHGPWAAPSAATALPHIIDACLPVTQQSGRIWNQCKQKAGIRPEKGSRLLRQYLFMHGTIQIILLASQGALYVTVRFLSRQKVFHISGAVHCFLLYDGKCR